MTDILDLPGWTPTATRTEGDEYVIEAEYTVPPTACQKCGVIGNLYKHGPKPVYIRDSPIRGRPVRILANAKRYKCRECGGLFVSMVTTKLAVGADGLKPISTNETRTICTHCSERFHTEDHPQHDSLTTR